MSLADRLTDRPTDRPTEGRRLTCPRETKGPKDTCGWYSRWPSSFPLWILVGEILAVGVSRHGQHKTVGGPARVLLLVAS